MSHWYVLQTSPQRELKAAEALRDLGYIVYCPTIQKSQRLSRTSKKTTRKLEALFNRYIFCHYQIPWHEMDSRNPRCIKDGAGNRMITGAVTICGRQEPIPDHVIGKIAEAAALLNMDMSKPPLSLKEGDIGIIRNGAFEGKQGKITSITKNDAEVALTIFNAVRMVKVKVEQLEAA